MAHRGIPIDAEAINYPKIYSGTIDGTVIGGTTPAAGTFTTVAPTTGLFLTVATAAAAGTTNADGTALTNYGINLVSGANDAAGVLLPTAVAGAIVLVKNLVTNKILKVYPGADDKVNGGTATTGALSMAAGTAAIFFAKDGVDWYTIPLLPS